MQASMYHNEHDSLDTRGEESVVSRSTTGYGSISKGDGGEASVDDEDPTTDHDYDDNDEDDDDEDDDDESSNHDISYGENASLISDEWQQQQDQIRRRRRFCGGDNCCKQCWKSSKECCSLILTVEDVWEEDGQQQQQQNSVSSSRQMYFIVLFWFTILATAYATERISFKVLVDRVGPFRVFSAEVITVAHTVVVGIGIIGQWCRKKQFELKPLGLPLLDIGLMALLDTVHLLLALTTGSYVAPTLTVILVQLTTPLIALFANFVEARSVCSTAEEDNISNMAAPRQNHNHQLFGSGGQFCGICFTILAVVLALVPSFISVHDPTIFSTQDSVPLRRAYNTIIFALACIPAAASQVYKEQSLRRYKQPVDASYLNLVLSLIQCAMALVLAPILYTLQGLGAGSDWIHLYPSMSVSKNFVDGMKCFFGTLDTSIAESTYAEEAQCEWSFMTVLIHVLSIVMVNVAVDKVVHAGATAVMYRGISAGMFLGVAAMYIYEYLDPLLNYGYAVNTLTLVCTLLLIFGSEAYYGTGLIYSTFETVFPELDMLYDTE